MASRKELQADDCSLVDILQAMAPAAEEFIEALLKHDCIGRARLVFRPLRDFIDNHMTKISLLLTPASRQRLPAGEPLPLARWPRLHQVNLLILPEEPDGMTNTRGMADLAGLPFVALSASAREQITTVKIRAHSLCGFDVEAAVPYLALLLPNLQELDLQRADSMSFQPHMQCLMHGSLSTLRHLHTLSLPSRRALPHVGKLAGGALRRLTVHSFADPDDRTLETRAVDAIAQLRELKELRIHAWSPASHRALSRLLNSLPPGLERLMLTGVGLDDGMELSIVDGQVRTARFGELGLTADDARLAQAVLDSRVMGPQFDHLSLDTVHVSAAAAAALNAPEVQPLWALLQRSRRAEVRELRLGAVSALPAVVRRLGMPAALSYETPDGWQRLNICGAAAVSAQGHAGIGVATGRAVNDSRSPPNGADALPPPPLPSAADVGQAALRRLATSSGGAASASAASSGSTRSADAVADPSCRLLLLRGPLLSALAKDPEALRDWVLSLGKQASVATGGGATPFRFVSSYLPLPAAAAECSAMLLRCGVKPGAAAAVAAAARAPATARAAGGVDLVAPVLGSADREVTLASIFLGAVQQELQALLDHHTASCGGKTDREVTLMQQVLALGERLARTERETWL